MDDHTEQVAPWTLSRGDSVTSPNHKATLTMQLDGNLCVYDEQGSARWGSDTVDRGWQADFQTDGNFVVYDVFHKPVWASHTADQPEATLWIQGDGNVVIYDYAKRPIWATHSEH